MQLLVLAEPQIEQALNDKLLEHREKLFTHLKDRWAGLFGATYDILLYELSSTYFKVDANSPMTEASRLKSFGYSRDKHPDCVQIVIALIITPRGPSHRV